MAAIVPSSKPSSTRLMPVASASLAEQSRMAEVICARHITSRRSRALLGGAQVTASQLAHIVGDQVTIHGQSEQVRLVDAARQLDVVDRAAGDELAGYLSRHAQLWSEFRAASQRLQRLNEDRAGAEMEREVLTRRVGEVDAVDPKPHEDDDLIAEMAGLQGCSVDPGILEQG